MESNTLQLHPVAIYLRLRSLRITNVKHSVHIHCSLSIPTILVFAYSLHAQPPCVVTQPIASFTIRHVAGRPALSLDPQEDIWKNAAAQSMSKDCSREIDYPNLRSEMRAFWTDTDLYIFFRCPYLVLNLFLPADNSQKHVGLWDRDVVEMFLG